MSAMIRTQRDFNLCVQIHGKYLFDQICNSSLEQELDDTRIYCAVAEGKQTPSSWNATFDESVTK